MGVGLGIETGVGPDVVEPIFMIEHPYVNARNRKAGKRINRTFLMSEQPFGLTI
jgi:hypothetical protein